MGSPPHQDAEPQLGSRQGRRSGLGQAVSKVGFERTGKSAQDSSHHRVNPFSPAVPVNVRPKSLLFPELLPNTCHCTHKYPIHSPRLPLTHICGWGYVNPTATAVRRTTHLQASAQERWPCSA